MNDIMQGGDGFYLEADDGGKLFVAQSGDSNAPTLILSTPLGGDIGMWDDMIAHLPEGLRIIRYDSRGLGRSSTPRKAFDIERLGRDVIAIMDQLGIERAFFCGVSLGGLTGIWLGAQHGSRFEGLILANTAASFPPPLMWQKRAEEALDKGMLGLIEPTLQRWFTPAFCASNDPRLQNIAAMIGRTDQRGYAACCQVLETTRLEPMLPAIDKPTLILVGSQDPSTPPVRGDELAEAIPGSKVVTLEASHVPSVELPDQFAAAVTRFLRETLGRDDDLPARDENFSSTLMTK